MRRAALLRFVGLLGALSASFQPAAADSRTFQPAAAASRAFVELEASKASYAIGERAILTAHVRIQPDNPSDEIFLSAKFAGEAIKLTSITDREAVSITPVFLAAGSFDWEVKVFLQDKHAAEELSATIAFYEEEVFRREQERDAETDPSVRAMLQAEIDRDQELIAQAKDELRDQRRPVEVSRLNVTVQARKALDGGPGEATPAMTVTADHGDGIYHVGESATFFVRVLTGFEGPDGPKEAVVRGKLDGHAIGGLQAAPREFAFTTDPFTTDDIGARPFQAKLYLRSQAKADSLRSAIDAGNARRDSSIALRDATTDPMRQAYYQRRIDDLTDVIDEFHRQLEALLTSAGTQTLTIQVVL